MQDFFIVPKHIFCCPNSNSLFMDKGQYDSGTYIINVWGYVEVFPKNVEGQIVLLSFYTFKPTL